MKIEHKKIEDLINDGNSPFPLSIIPNNMGINLVSVDSLSWTKQDDGQFVNLTINFIPDNEPKKLGTVEPIALNAYPEWVEGSAADTIRFINGAVKKYGADEKYHTPLVKYVNELLDGKDHEIN